MSSPASTACPMRAKESRTSPMTVSASSKLPVSLRHPANANFERAVAPVWDSQSCKMLAAKRKSSLRPWLASSGYACSAIVKQTMVCVTSKPRGQTYMARSRSPRALIRTPILWHVNPVYACVGDFCRRIRKQASNDSSAWSSCFIDKYVLPILNSTLKLSRQ